MKAEEKIEIMQEEEMQKKEWNRAVLRHVKKLRQIAKPSIDFPKTIETACEQYLSICEDDGVKPSVSGLALALGVRRETLLKWVNGDINNNESGDIIRYYFSLLEIFDETALKDNKTNAVSGIFIAKNNYGYKDEIEIKKVDEKPLSIEEIEKKYREMHEIIDIDPIAIENKEDDNK